MTENTCSSSVLCARSARLLQKSPRNLLWPDGTRKVPFNVFSYITVQRYVDGRAAPNGCIVMTRQNNLTARFRFMQDLDSEEVEDIFQEFLF